MAESQLLAVEGLSRRVACGLPVVLHWGPGGGGVHCSDCGSFGCLDAWRSIIGGTCIGAWVGHHAGRGLFVQPAVWQRPARNTKAQLRGLNMCFCGAYDWAQCEYCNDGWFEEGGVGSANSLLLAC